MNDESNLPLSDLCVLSIEQYGAGPYATSHLAELGARVIKIEDVRDGDVGRSVPPFTTDSGSLFFETFNRGKESVSLDFTADEGRAVFHQLVASADVVFSNLRGDVPARLGLRYEDLSSVNPRVVCVSLSAFGMTGPRSKEPGYDYIMQALSGWMDLTGEPGAPPAKSGLSLVDYCAGLVATSAILAAVHQARRTGTGTDCDLSLHDTSVSLLTYLATWHLTADWSPERLGRSAHPSLVPFQLFQGSDSRWFVLGCAKEKFWTATREELATTDLQDERFGSFASRQDHKDELIRLLDEVFSTAPASEWVSRLSSRGVPCAPVLSVQEALADPQVAARDLVVSTDHPEWGTIQQLRSPVRVGDRTAEPTRAPLHGEHTASVLSGLLQLDGADIEALRSKGLVGGPQSGAMNAAEHP